MIMEINKQLFEDVLSGKLKGTFVLRSGCKYNSNKLRKTKNNLFSYRLNSSSYTETGYFYLDEISCFDIIDFIPDTDMKENKLEITIPEGQEIDWQESAKQEKIVFKKIDNRPRSWEEYCMSHKQVGYFIDINGDIEEIHYDDSMSPSTDKNLLPSKELAEAFIAMMQLMSLRKAWVGNWEPDWNATDSNKYCIEGDGNYDFRITILSETRSSLSFPTEEMAKDFMNCFEDLLNVAKPLI